MKLLRIVPIALVVILVVVTNWAAPPAFGASYVVDTTAEDTPSPALTACTGAAGDCSLRGAITNANAASTPGDVITFDPTVFPAGTPASITLTAAGTSMSGGGDTIDGTGAGVILRGNAEPGPFICLSILSAGNTVKGLQVTDCQDGIRMAGTGADNNIIGPGNVAYDNTRGIRASSADATGNLIIGNKIGTNAGGTAVHPDGGNDAGILLIGGNNTIGGTAAADRNIISGSIGAGIELGGAGASGNLIIGNYIGTDVTGSLDVGNAIGIALTGGAISNTVGGLAAGERNLISGNASQNVLLNGAVSNTVTGNIIGPDITGNGGAMINAEDVRLAASMTNTIGPGNMISDGSFGINVSGAASQGNVIKGNIIGTSLAPNSASGVVISDASLNTIGGVNPADGNVIAFNGGDGIRMLGVTATGNTIRSNSIHDNATLEIELTSGGNTELAGPALTGAGSAAAGGTACANCTIDVFSDGVADAEFFEGSTVADGGGNFLLAAPIAGPMVTATQTDASGNTSELSGAIAFTADGDADGFPNTLDNCPTTPNPSQADADDDGVLGVQPDPGGLFGGDECDADDDGDSLVDGSDSCPVLAEDFDGFEDTNGCPDPDNDLDGVCDAGQSNVSCAGSDSGQACFDPAGTLSCPTNDCRNVAEDVDAFKDNDGCPEPDNDNDGFPDATDACPGAGSQTGADGMLGAPEDVNHNGVQDGAEVALTTDDIMPLLAWEDADGVLDTDGCHDSPGEDFDSDGFNDNDEVFIHLTDAGNPDTDADTVIDGSDNCPNWPNTPQNLPPWTIPALDSDCDGFTVAREQWTGTNPTKHCNANSGTNNEPDAWPSDFNDSQLTSLADVVLMSPAYNLSTGSDPAKKRFDLNASGLVSLADVVLMGPFYNKSCG